MDLSPVMTIIHEIGQACRNYIQFLAINLHGDRRKSPADLHRFLLYIRLQRLGNVVKKNQPPDEQAGGFSQEGGEALHHASERFRDLPLQIL